MNKANESILELIDIIVAFEMKDYEYLCYYPEYRYPKTEEEIKYHKIYCEELGCDKCEEMFKEKLTEYYKNRYLIKEELL